jgi:RNA polymerase sigma-70 factor (ECF subfamily)
MRSAWVYQELPFRDIAVALATTANAAKVSYHHAVKRLRSLIADAA